MTSLFGAAQPWVGQPEFVDLPTQGVRRKTVLAGFSHDMSEQHIRAHCAEADIFLEIFFARCKERGFAAIEFGGNPVAQGEGAGFEKRDEVEDKVLASRRSYAYIETASKHTGTNVEFAGATLRRLSIDPSTACLAVVQHPQLQRRACLTWAKQMGRSPASILGWTISATPAVTNRSKAEMLRYALGELQRIPLYSRLDKGFIDLPDDFPWHVVAPLEALEAYLHKKPSDWGGGGGGVDLES